MRYVGGKSKVAADIAKIVTKSSGTTYLEPFLGGGSVFPHIAPYYKYKFAGDSHVDLMLMWQALQSGWEPPEFVDENTYQALKYEEPSPLRGLAGFGQSFGAKWFGGYARGKTAKGESRQYLAETVRNLQKILPYMSDATLMRREYWDWFPQREWVVYCDPPYQGTQGYGNSFDHDKFWEIMTAWSESGAEVYVSEYQAPDHWACVGEFSHKLSLTLVEQGREPRIERLWKLV